MSPLRCRRLAAALLFLCAGAALPARATIRYDVSLAQPALHTFHVTMTIPAVAGGVTVQIPAWDALYQIRDFGYRITGLHASDSAGRPLRAARVDGNTWRITGVSPPGSVIVAYNSYWDEPGPFGTQLNAVHAFLNPAMVLCYVPERRAEDTLMQFADVPQGWRIAVELPVSSLSAPGAVSYAAPSYDALVDAPAEIGQFDEFSFHAANRPIRVVVHRDPQDGRKTDDAQLEQMLSRIVDYESGMMAGAPFQEYLFLFHFGRLYGGGGMEHSNSTAISVSASDDLANVSAHEFFHLWNVKRIRPQSLEPLDHIHEMWSPSLWFAEGVTSAYAAYTLVRTGLWSERQFLDDLSDQITELEMRPAHRWQSAEDSSLDAWFEKYQLYNTPQFSISYYNKGQLLGVALDISIRDATDNRASLDDVLRRLNTEYAERGRYYPDSAGIREAAEEVVRDANAGTSPGAALNLDDFFSRYVSGTDEMPFAGLLARAGLHLQAEGQRRAALGFAVMRDARGGAVVDQLDPDSPAARAGLQEGDVLEDFNLAAGARPAGSVVLMQRPEFLQRALRDAQPGDVMLLHARRGGAEKEISFALGEAGTVIYTVDEAPDPTPGQRRILNGLLHGTTDNSGNEK